MNIKDSYLHGGTHLVKDISFAANSGVIKATITWALEGVENTVLTFPAIGGASFGSQTANYVLAAPNGSAGNPTFRALVAADISSGTFAAARLPLASNSAKGAVILGSAQTSDQDSAITDKKYWVKMNANGKIFVDVPWSNTWRGIQDNLTSSTNTTESLSAKQGYLLANGSARDNTKLPLAGGTMTGAIKRYYSAASNDPMVALTSNNQDIWLWRINNGTAVSVSTSGVYGFGLKYIGTGSDNNNDLVLYADALNGTQVAAMTMNQDGTITLAKTPKVGSTNVSLAGHKHAYTDLTGSSTTANQAIVSNGTANGWTLKTLGSRAFDSTDYVKLDAGAAEQTIKNSISSLANGSIEIWRATAGGYAMIGFSNGTTKNKLGMLGFNTTNNPIFRNTSNNDYNIAHAGNITDKAATITSSSTTLATIAGKNITAKLPTNAKDTAGIVAGPGAAGKVYISNSSGAPTWDTFDTTVTSGSSHLVTSGAVYTAIANNIASAVQYQGTITSEADMIALTGAGQGDFARVITEFTFTDATGASVTAHVGDVVYLTNNTPGTSSNWIVAHTEIDTDTWTEASTNAAGYVPKLITGGADLAAASTDYVLAYVNGTTTPVWRKLPANAYKNDNTTGVKLAAVSGTKKTDSTLIKIASGTGLSIAGGTNKFSIGDGTNYIEVPITISITNNVTGSGTSGKLVKWNGTNTITDGPTLSNAISSQTQSTKFLREDGSWTAPSYTTDTVRPIYTGGTPRFTNAQKTAINFIGAGATSVTFLAAGTESGSANYASIKISSNNDLVKFSAITASTEYYLPVRAKNTTDTAQLLYRTGIIVKDSTITATLSGNAETATDLKEANMRGWLYQDGDKSTNGTGVGTRATTGDNSIGIPVIHHTSSSNDTYVLSKVLFRKTSADSLAASTIYIGDSIRSNKFVCVKSKNATDDDWSGSSTSGSGGSGSGSGTTYTAGDGISINNSGVISVTRKEYYLTEAQFNALPSLDSNTTYYIMTT